MPSDPKNPQDDSGFLLQPDIPDINASASDIARGPNGSLDGSNHKAEMVVGQAASFKRLVLYFYT